MPRYPRAALLIGVLCLLPSVARSAVVPLSVDRATPGAPVTFGVPFPKGVLKSPDRVRVLNERGLEVESQITEVNSWAPADDSVQWIWVDFLTDGSRRYSLEYGGSVSRKSPVTKLRIVNSQRPAGGLDVDTGAIRFHIARGPGGFIRDASVLAGGAFRKAVTDAGRRGSFLDLLDDAGPDRSEAFVTHTAIEKGSGPLHAILRLEGEYRYTRADNRPAPFVTRIHVWSGKPWIKVLHTVTYTGVPDKRRAQEGQHRHVATQGAALLREDPSDHGFVEPNDRIAAAGMVLHLAEAPVRTRAGLVDGEWWMTGGKETVLDVTAAGHPALFQTGPKPDRMPPVPESRGSERIAGFEATMTNGSDVVARAARAAGWYSVSGPTVGVAAAFRDMVQEYPKAFEVDTVSGTLTASLWPAQAGPMSFARYSMKPEMEEGVETMENGATGLAKTTELAFVLRASTEVVTAEQDARSLVDLPWVKAPPRWYAASEAFGHLAPRTGAHPELERALDTKFDWWLFNQTFVPWFGMWDYGDGKLNFDPATGSWDIWGNNEPAQDLQLWMQFTRTGDARFARAAQALSRHSMDVDNIHWPAKPVYRGDTNTSSDYWKTLGDPAGSPYVGLGRRHGAQHWLKTLSAHVWVAGWLADYYLAADHRGLDMAIQTGEMHLRRIFGEHDLTGRRLYLSLWNLSEVWNATKDPRFGAEVRERVERLLALQREQGDSLVVDRYGYAHHYVTRGLDRFLAINDDADASKRVTSAIIRNARRVRDMPPLNHQMESYLASTASLVAGYRLTEDEGMAAELRRRLDLLRLDAVDAPEGANPQTLAAAIERASHLPPDPARPGDRALWSASNGLRVFGWTHAFTLPYALRVLEELDEKARPKVRKPVPTR